MTEEELIRTIFAPLTQGFPGALGLKDDCALLSPAEGYDLVLTTDAIAAGVHFFADDEASDIAWKALAVNVSDLAAKGAKPICYLLSAAFPEAPDREWLVGFSQGLRAAHDRFGIHLAGGDTDRRPGPMTFSVTAIGQVPKREFVPRTGARPGDVLFVTGTLGNSALGLALRRGDPWTDRLALDRELRQEFVRRYLRPEPRLDIGPVLRAYAHAAMDISDGLLKDLNRLAGASQVAAHVDVAAVPLDAALAPLRAHHPEILDGVLTGGDDYEILAAVPLEAATAFEAAARAAQCPVSRIGNITDGTGLTAMGDTGEPLHFSRSGWDHFS